jgi:hypothetical protein
VRVIVVVLATYGFVLTGSDATAPSRGTFAPVPKSVTLSWYAVIGWSFAKKVSIAT